jgi:hypothetical protein
VSSFHYLRPSWRNVEDFLSYCSEFDGSERQLLLEPALRALRPIFRSPTFAEATRALQKYHRIVARERRAEARRRRGKSANKGNDDHRRQHPTHTNRRRDLGTNAIKYTCIPWEQPTYGLAEASQPHRIAVLSVATGPYEDIYARNDANPDEQAEYEAARNASLADRQRYCEHHGYACYVFHDVVEGRAAGWYRLPAVLAMLGQKKHDWVFHLDLDAVIWDHSVRLEEFLDPRYDLITSVAYNGINNGVFFIRNSTWSRLFYAEAWTRTHEQNSEFWAEQAALSGILHDTLGAQNHVKLMPHAFFNTFLPEGETELPSQSAGAFIVHFAGRSDKWKLVQEFVQQRRGSKVVGESNTHILSDPLVSGGRLPPADDDTKDRM